MLLLIMPATGWNDYGCETVKTKNLHFYDIRMAFLPHIYDPFTSHFQALLIASLCLVNVVADNATIPGKSSWSTLVFVNK